VLHIRASAVKKINARTHDPSPQHGFFEALLPQTAVRPSNAAEVNGNALVNKDLQEPDVTMLSKGVLTVQLLLD